ncbi:MAG: 2-heptaprenyl-1,4-naphthoquinone methyltransferase [Anaerolineaceae bacterium]|nr:2-heptaprenyl-1,4-naphthoquinone methyltransferase [Anaerolineaceae bacterium]
MPTYHEQQTKQNYNKISRWYDLISGSSEQKFRKMGLELLNAQPGNQVLEIGCGTGQSLLTIKQQVQPTGAVYGLDLSPGMLSVAQKRIRDSGIKHKPQLINGSALNLPFLNNSLDAVFMSFTLELFPENTIHTVLNQIYRILKPNAKLCLVHMAQLPQPNLMIRLYLWAHQTYPNICDCRPLDSEPYLETLPFHTITSLQKNMWGLPVKIYLLSKTGGTEV